MQEIPKRLRRKSFVEIGIGDALRTSIGPTVFTGKTETFWLCNTLFQIHPNNRQQRRPRRYSPNIDQHERWAWWRHLSCRRCRQRDGWARVQDTAVGASAVAQFPLAPKGVDHRTRRVFHTFFGVGLRWFICLDFYGRNYAFLIFIEGGFLV